MTHVKTRAVEHIYCCSPNSSERGAPEMHCSTSSPGLSVREDSGRTVGHSEGGTTQNGAQMPA